MKWLRQLISRRKLYGDLSEEIQGHLEEKVEELEEARYAARREFGNITLAEESSREVWHLFRSGCLAVRRFDL